jgi:hypothetical protein
LDVTYTYGVAAYAIEPFKEQHTQNELPGEALLVQVDPPFVLTAAVLVLFIVYTMVPFDEQAMPIWAVPGAVESHVQLAPPSVLL